MKMIAERVTKTDRNGWKVHAEYVIDQLRAFRKANKMTTQSVAMRMHTTASAVSRMENPRREPFYSPTMRTLVRYADAVDCDIEFNIKRKKVV